MSYTDTKRFAVKSGKREHVLNTRLAIEHRQDFKTSGAMYGTTRLDTSWGRLRGKEQDRFVADRGDIDYVVVSYGTPIAWHVKDTESEPAHWVLVLSKFSATTSSHQSAIRNALTGTEWQDAGE
jgi:hypothetical protein